MNKNFTLLAMVFFLWGNITAINSGIIIFFFQYFHIGWRSAMLATVLFYIAPFIACLPCSWLISRWGYRRVLQYSLLITAAGCLALAGALRAATFPGSLMATFLVALGIAALQVVANPYLALLCPPDKRTGHLSLASAVNSLGTTLAPLVLAFLLSNNTVDPVLHREPISSLWLVLAVASFMIAAGITVLRLPDVTGPIPVIAHPSGFRQRPQMLFHVAAIFGYVGVEVTLATNLVKYLLATSSWQTSTALSLITFYWGGALLGRLLFGLLAHRLNNGVIFIGATLFCLLLVALAMMLNNQIGSCLLLAAGFGNAVMYPIIFSDGINRYLQQANVLAAAMVMAGIGGAVIPWLQTLLGDAIGLRASFVLPLIMYLLLALWGMRVLAQRKTDLRANPASLS